MIVLSDLNREENKDNCFKCGLSLTNRLAPHSERECDYSPIKPEHIIDAIQVKDVEITDIKIKSGYGIWELTMIHKIMEDLWRNHTSFREEIIDRQREYMSLATTMHYWTDSSLFYAAEKIYKKQINKEN